MNKEIEDILLKECSNEMQKVRDFALANGIRTAAGIIIEIAQDKKKSEHRRLQDIINFCNKSLGVTKKYKIETQKIETEENKIGAIKN